MSSRMLAASLSALVFLSNVAPAPAVVAHQAAGQGVAKRRSLRPLELNLVKPLSFDQRLLVCNAYPSDASVLVQKNEKEMLADESHPLRFKECRYLQSKLLPRDKLDMMVVDQDVHGSFEVGDLPNSDAVLLLVLGKRSDSSLMDFQSFAFPMGSDSKDAQIAVIDAYLGNSTAPRLRMEDHISGKEAQTVSRRIEQLNFNRVYTVERGTYDASVADPSRSNNATTELKLEKVTKQVLTLASHQNYVVLRTGDGEHFPEALAFFPQPHKSHSHRSTCGVVVASVLALFSLARVI